MVHGASMVHGAYTRTPEKRIKKIRKEKTIRAGPAKIMFKRQIGHASINYAKLNLKFWHGVVHVLVDTLTACPFYYIFLPERDDRSKNATTTKTIQASQKKENQRGQEASMFARAVRIRG